MMNASEAIVDTLLETDDDDVDPKDYVGDDPYPGLSLDPLPGNRDAWQVFRRGRVGYSACLGTLFFDLHSDMAPEAHLHWKDANWIASPISPNKPIRAFRTKDEAVAYLKA